MKRIEKVLTVIAIIVINGLGTALFSWFSLGSLELSFIMTWSIGLLFCSLMFWGVLENILYVAKEDAIIDAEKEIPYPWNILVILAGGTISALAIVSLYLI
jgi:hypothetical protein